MKWLLIIIIILLIGVGLYFLVNAWIMRGVKTPPYLVIKRSHTIEIRQYQPMLIAQITVKGDRQTAIRVGFKQLAAFIFGENHTANNHFDKIAMTAPVMQQSEKIAMTTPVMQQTGTDNQWQIRFVMPARYTKATLPKPNNNHIKIIEVPAQTKVAIRFTGTPTLRRLQQQTKKLERYLKKQQLTPIGTVEYAFYNPPWTLPLLRRNEIMQEIKNELQ